MSFAFYKFTEYEEDLIEEHYKDFIYSEKPTYCEYKIRCDSQLEFDIALCRMLKTSKENKKIDFWVNPSRYIFISSSLKGSRNVWEYYLYTLKRLDGYTF